MDEELPIAGLRGSSLRFPGPCCLLKQQNLGPGDPRQLLDGRCTSTILRIITNHYESLRIITNHYALLEEQVRRARSDDGRL